MRSLYYLENDRSLSRLIFPLLFLQRVSRRGSTGSGSSGIITNEERRMDARARVRPCRVHVNEIATAEHFALARKKCMYARCSGSA
jgi:hypothetical protein